MPDSASFLYSFIAKNEVFLCHRTIFSTKQVSEYNLFWNQPSMRVICQSKNKTIFTEIFLIHLKRLTTGKEKYNYRSWNTKREKNVSYLEEYQFAIFYQKVIFKPKISFI